MSQNEARHQQGAYSAVDKSEHSIFETMKITEAGIQFSFLHWWRMKNGGRMLGINVPDYVEWINRLEEYCLGITGPLPLALRVSLKQEREDYSLKWQPPQWSFGLREIPYTQEQYRKGVKIIILEESRTDFIPLTYIKSSDYLDTGPALKNVEVKNAFEGIWLNLRGEVVEGTKSNIFFVRQGTICTPSTASGCLAGTRRQIVKNLAQRLRIPFEERDVFPQDVLQADEVFLTNALMGIMPVNQIENRLFKESAGDGIAGTLIQSYKEI